MLNLPVPLPIAVLLLCAVLAAWTDVLRRKIPNIVVLPGIAAAMFASYHEFGWSSGLVPSFYGLAVGFILSLPMYALRALGAGDVKLLLLVGAATGTVGLIEIASIAVVLAGLIGLAMSLLTGKFRVFIANLQIGAMAIASRDFKVATSVSGHTAYRVPFALAVAMSVVIWLFYLW